MLALLAVLGVVLVSLLPRSSAPVAAAADELVLELRRVQMEAMASVGGASLVPVVAAGISVTPATELRFDPWGRPVDGAGVALEEDFVLTLSDGSNSRQVRIVAGSGWVGVE